MHVSVLLAVQASKAGLWGLHQQGSFGNPCQTPTSPRSCVFQAPVLTYKHSESQHALPLGLCQPWHGQQRTEEMRSLPLFKSGTRLHFQHSQCRRAAMEIGNAWRMVSKAADEAFDMQVCRSHLSPGSDGTCMLGNVSRLAGSRPASLSEQALSSAYETSSINAAVNIDLAPLITRSFAAHQWSAPSVSEATVCGTLQSADAEHNSKKRRLDQDGRWSISQVCDTFAAPLQPATIEADEPDEVQSCLRSAMSAVLDPFTPGARNARKQQHSVSGSTAPSNRQHVPTRRWSVEMQPSTSQEPDISLSCFDQARTGSAHLFHCCSQWCTWLPCSALSSCWQCSHLPSE